MQRTTQHVFVLHLVGALLLAGGARAHAQRHADPNMYIPGEYIIRLKQPANMPDQAFAGALADFRQQLTTHLGPAAVKRDFSAGPRGPFVPVFSISHAVPSRQGVQADLERNVLADVAERGPAHARKPILEVQRSFRYALRASRPRVMESQTGIESVRAHVTGRTGKNVAIAIIDTGIYKHADLSVADAQILDCTGTSCVQYTGPGDGNDDNGHGTHLAGIIAAQADGRGVVGVAPDAKLYALKAFGHDGTASTTTLLNALSWIYDHNTDPATAAADFIRVGNVSWGHKDEDLALKDAMDELRDTGDGVIWVASAGNAHEPATKNYPAAWSDTVVAVASTMWERDRADEPALVDWDPDSNFGETAVVATAAPGRDVLSTWNDGGYIQLGGTSTAAAHISGVVALMLEDRTAAGLPETGKTMFQSVRDRLKDRGRPLVQVTDPVPYNAGNGRLEVSQATPNTGTGDPRGTWTVACTSITGGVATWTIAKPDTTTATVTTGTVFTDAGTGVEFVVHDGSAPYQVGDDFEFVTDDLQHPNMKTVLVANAPETLCPGTGLTALLSANTTAPQVNTPVWFSAGYCGRFGSYDYQWNWGDTTSSGPSTDPWAEHVYTTTGPMTVTLTVRDVANASISAQTTLAINVQP